MSHLFQFVHFDSSDYGPLAACTSLKRILRLAMEFLVSIP